MPLMDYKDYRKYLILNLIYYSKTISRTKIADITGYRLSTVSEIVAELIDERLIIESGSAYSGQGRRRTLLTMNCEYVCSIGLYVGTTNVNYIVSTIDGTVLTSVTTELSVSATAETHINEILSTLNKLIAQYSTYKILGIGICDSGRDPVELNSAMDFSDNFAHFNDWIHNDLRSCLEKELNLPVETHANETVAIVAEHRFGCGKNCDDFIWLILNNGVGMGIFSTGTVIKGADHCAGQIGHTVVNQSNDFCFCGMKSCIETTASFPAICKKILNALDNDVHSVLNTYYDRSQKLTTADIRYALDHQDKLCMLCVKEAAQNLGTAISNVVNLLNPKTIILSGFMLELGDYYINNVKEAVLEHSLSYLSNNLEFYLSTVSVERTLTLGAAAMVFDTFLDSNNFKWIANLGNLEHS